MRLKKGFRVLNLKNYMYNIIKALKTRESFFISVIFASN